ncbi:transposase [Cupriavidus necator]
MGRAKNRSEPHGSRATWFQAPPPRRSQWRPHQCHPDRRPPQRCYPVAAARRCDSSHPRRARRPLQKPKVIFADRGYDSDPHRQLPRERGIKPVIARRRTEHGSGLGTFRWVVERTHSWRHNFRRLRIRFDRRADIHEAFLKFGCALVCWNIFRRT